VRIIGIQISTIYMKAILLSVCTLFTTAAFVCAGVEINMESYGKNMGGWTKRGNTVAEYSLSGSSYRTYKPEISPTPDGGLFVSVRIDYVRGWLASDDHATLEITVNSKGMIVSAQSFIAIQGRSVTSDLILGADMASKQVVGGPERAVQIGADLVSNISAKMLRENIVEAGRVSFPAVLRHNYNLLFQAVRVDGEPVILTPPVARPVGESEYMPGSTPGHVFVPSTPAHPPATPPVTHTTTPATPLESNATPLVIKPYSTPNGAEIPPN
jgi:hypothetical protein